MKKVLIADGNGKELFDYIFCGSVVDNMFCNECPIRFECFTTGYGDIVVDSKLFQELLSYRESKIYKGLRTHD